jgi:hypothetical protein
VSLPAWDKRAEWPLTYSGDDSNAAAGALRSWSQANSWPWPPAVEQAMEAFLGVPARTAAILTLPAFPLGVDRVRLQRVADAMLRFGLLKRPFNTSAMVG